MSGDLTDVMDAGHLDHGKDNVRALTKVYRNKEYFELLSPALPVSLLGASSEMNAVQCLEAFGACRYSVLRVPSSLCCHGDDQALQGVSCWLTHIR